MKNLEEETINIQQFAENLMSLTSYDIEELINELKQHWWKTDDDNNSPITTDKLSALSILMSTKNDMLKDINLQLAKWLKKYEELQHQHEEDEMWMECTNEQIKFYKELFKYISKKAIGDKGQIIETIADNSYNSFVGYVKVKKTLNEKQELLITFNTNNGDTYTAKWQPSDNYATYQTCSIAGDDYQGYLLFPTYKDNEYFCIYFQC